jgi:hypothetical protein
MKNAVRGLSVLALALAALTASADGPLFPRNNSPLEGKRPPLVTQVDQPNGTGLAPTTWGFASSYSGSLYGTGYYAFKVDATFSFINSMYGYTYSYPSNGFVNDIKAIYAFDVSGLDGQPSPVWSSFMFDTRERPAPGAFKGMSSFAFIELESDGGAHRLTGSLLFTNNNAVNLDIYDAEDFENAAPFDHPELAFSGTGNTLIGTFPVTTDKIMPLDFDVTDAVNADLGPGGPTGPPVVEVPTLGDWGLLALSGLLAVAGALLLRR